MRRASIVLIAAVLVATAAPASAAISGRIVPVEGIPARAPSGGSSAVGFGSPAPAPPLAAALSSTVKAAPTSKPLFVPGEVLVRFGGVSATVTSKRAAHSAAGGLRARGIRGVPGFERVTLKSGASVAQAVAAYREQPGVISAQPNYIRRIFTTPNDPDYSDLWGLHNTGGLHGVATIPGIADSDIDAPEAWASHTGSSGVIVAVVDTGIDYNHPDLSGNIWTNPGETAGNGLDDDHNGYVDDVHGYDFAYGEGDPMDRHSHGTHCAGTIGAQGNNSLGIVGVNWDVSVMAVKGLGDDGSGDDAELAEAISYAATMGADVISCSWGGPGGSNGDVISTAIVGAQAKGSLVVCAAGNEAANTDITPNYPSCYSAANILAVAATDDRDLLADFSNYGATTVDIAAPGVDILSTVPGTPVWGSVLLTDPFSVSADWSVSSVHQDWSLTNDRCSSAPYSIANAYYYNNEDAYLFYEPAVDLSGVAGAGVRFDYWMELEDGYDYLYVLARHDPADPWEVVASGTGSSHGWSTATLDVGEFVGDSSVYFAFELVADHSLTEEGIYIDDFQVVEKTATNYGAAYEYMNGTSMATPHTSGVAGLLKSKHPEADYGWDDLKYQIMQSAEGEGGNLYGQCVTNGRLNAYWALWADEDAYEADDTSAAANLSTVGTLYQHTEYPRANPDWRSFDASAGERYSICTTDPQFGSDTVLYLYDTDGSSEITRSDDVDASKGDYSSAIMWTCPASGRYYIRNSAAYNMGGSYKMGVRAVAPPVAADDTLTTSEDTTLVIDVNADLLANDSGDDGAPLVIDSFTQPLVGTVLLEGGSGYYAPPPDFHGQTTFTYRCNDGDGAGVTPSAWATVTVNVIEVVPVAEDDTLTTTMDTTLAIDIGADLLANDSDGDGDALVIDSFTQPQTGTVSLDGGGSSYYVPPLGFHGQTTFTYRCNDGDGVGVTPSAWATVTIDVTHTPGEVARASGSDRYAVAVKMARDGWDPAGDGSFPGVKHVIVACGEPGKEADPLCAGGLAGAYDAPILLTRTSSLNSSAKSVIAQIASANTSISVHIVGGTASVTNSVKSAIDAIGGVEHVTRLKGADRYEVSANVAKRICSYVGTASIPGSILICGENSAAFYDALAASPISYANTMPMLAVRKSSVPSTVWSVLNGSAYLAGKPRYAASSSSYINSAYVSFTERLTTTSDRYYSAIAIADAAEGKGWLSRSSVGIAAKTSDALGGGAFMGRRGGPLLYTTTSSTMAVATYDWLYLHRYEVTNGWIFGGTASVPAAQETQFIGILQ